MSVHDTLVQELQALGLGGLEARVYLALMETDRPVTGYQIAKVLGVARANVYDALRGLYEAGVVWQRREEGGAHYRPLPFEQLAFRLRNDLEARIARLMAELGPSGAAASGTWQATGWQAFADQANAQVANAAKEVIIGASPLPVQLLKGVFPSLTLRGVRLRFHCWSQCPPLGCGVCQPPTPRLTPLPIEQPSAVLIDGRHVVMTTGPERRANVVSTDDPIVVAGVHSLLDPPDRTRGGMDGA